MSYFEKYAENGLNPVEQADSLLSKIPSPYRSALMAALVGTALGGTTGTAIGTVNRIRSMFDPVTRAKRRLKREEQKALEARFHDLDSGIAATPGKGVRNGAITGALSGAAIGAGLYGANKLMNGEWNLPTLEDVQNIPKNLDLPKLSSYTDDDSTDYFDDYPSDYGMRIGLAVAQKVQAALQQPKTAAMPSPALQRLNNLQSVLMQTKN
jgi:hypothetical protein